MSPSQPSSHSPGQAAQRDPAGTHAHAESSSRFTVGDDGANLDSTVTSMMNLFEEALDGAIALVRADGGEIATLDESRHEMVLRARRSRPRTDLHPGRFGAPALRSQPVPSRPVGLAPDGSGS